MPLYLRALGFLELSLGAAAAAARHLSRALELAEQYGILEPGVYRVHADLIEALVASGRARAGRSGARGVRGAEPRQAGSPWSLATGARSRALLLAARGELEAAERAFEEALAEHERLPCRSSARGRCSRSVCSSGAGTSGAAPRSRSSRRIATFDELGAPLWAARARARAAPARRPPDEPR